VFLSHVAGFEGLACWIRRMASHSTWWGMKQALLKWANRLHQDETAQGLVEYVLIFALVTFAATAGIGVLASNLNKAFSTIGSVFGNYI
jgi:pilus assembly protein Flp/PilA